MGRLAVALLAGVFASTGGACSAPPAVESGASSVAAPAPASPAVRQPQRLRVEIVATYPHDPKAYTQGLLWHDGALYESTGQYGASSLRRVRLADGEVERKVVVADERFAEGLALVGDELVQLTWKEGIAARYAVADLSSRGEFRYVGEGWGLTYDGARLVMSDGSDRLLFRDPKTFAPIGEISVVRAGQPAFRLNELEFVEGKIWANVWQSDEILAIDPQTGAVTAVVDASNLLTGEDRLDAEVLNGLAWNPERKHFYVTGKYWPKLFEVAFVPVP